MSARIDLPSRVLPTMNRLARRSVAQMAFMRALYGPLDDSQVVGLDYDALSETEPPVSASRAQLVANPPLLRRVLGPLVLLRDHSTWTPDFRELVIASCKGLPGATADSEGLPARTRFERSLARLHSWAKKRFAFKPQEQSRRGVRAALHLLDPEELLDVEPSYVRVSNGVFTVSRRARVQAPLPAIAKAINPVNWATMGDFFEHVARVGKSGADDDKGWRDLFEERFVIGWGPVTINSYRAFLNVDFTVDDSWARADYSLAYEQDDQLEVDDGYLEVKTIPGRSGWCEYYAEKSTKFRSPGSNLLAPAILAVSLESNLSSIEDAAYDQQERDKVAAGDAGERGGAGRLESRNAAHQPGTKQ